jgi:hypothetical protein
MFKNMTNQVGSIRDDMTTSNSFIIFIILGINVIVILGSGTYLVYYYKKTKKLEMLRRM